jgi:hypothetical protein
MSPSNRSPSLAGKLCDPVCVCVIVSVVLAMSTSIALRMLTVGSGPPAAYGAGPSMIQGENAYLPTPPRAVAETQPAK